jgi:hypothetical protein
MMNKYSTGTDGFRALCHQFSASSGKLYLKMQRLLAQDETQDWRFTAKVSLILNRMLKLHIDDVREAC